MKFAIIVLIVLAVISLAGMFLGEFYPVKAGGPGWQEFWRQELGISAPLFKILTFLELHDPYRSWWYQILLLLLSLSLFTCISERFTTISRLLRIGAPRSAEEIKRLPLSEVFTTGKSPDALRERLPSRFRYRIERPEKEMRMTGQRGSIAHLGPILLHSGLLCLAIGGLLASWLGFATRLQGLPGDLMSDEQLDFQVRVDSFKIEYYPLGLGQYVLVDDSFIGKIVGRQGDDVFLLETRTQHDDPMTITADKSRLRNRYDIQMDRGNISDYISVLTVLEDDRETYRHRVEVNHPMRYKGYRFYQTSFNSDRPRVEANIDSAQIAIKRRSDGTVVDSIVISLDDPLELPDGSELLLTRFLPDFRLDGSEAVSASADLRNPALLFEVRRSDEELYHQWSFLNNPFHHSSSGAVYTFEVLDIFGFSSSVTYPTILEVKKTPGARVIWLGFILATLGLMLSFYLSPERIWLVARDKGEGRCEVTIGGTCKKNKEIFRRKFDGWVQRLKVGCALIN